MKRRVGKYIPIERRRENDLEVAMLSKEITSPPPG